MTIPRRRLALLACLGAGLGTLFDSSVVNYTVPGMQASLGASTAAVQWYLSSYSLTFGLGLVPGGRLGDAWGRRALFVAGLLVFAIGALFSATALSVELVILGRLVQGFGAGLVSAQVLGTIQDEFAGRPRVRALTLYSMAGATAAVLGPLSAGVLLQWLPEEWAWRAVLLPSLPIVLLSALAAGRALQPRTRQRGVFLDLPAIVLLGAFVVFVTLPVIDPGPESWQLAAILLTAGALAVGLWAWERRLARRDRPGRVPLFAPALLRAPRFVAGNVVAMLWFGAVLGHGAVVTMYLLQGQHQLAGLAVAAVLIPGSLARIIASTFVNRALDRFGTVIIPVALGLQAVAVGLLAVVLLQDADWLLAGIVAAECLLGVASGFIEPPLRAVTLDRVGSDVRGVAASFLQLTQRLAATFTVALFTGILLGFGDGLGADGAAAALALNAAMAVAAAAVAALRLTRRPG